MRTLILEPPIGEQQTVNIAHLDDDLTIRINRHPADAWSDKHEPQMTKLADAMKGVQGESTPVNGTICKTIGRDMPEATGSKRNTSFGEMVGTLVASAIPGSFGNQSIRMLNTMSRTLLSEIHKGIVAGPSSFEWVEECKVSNNAIRAEINRRANSEKKPETLDLEPGTVVPLPDSLNFAYARLSTSNIAWLKTVLNEKVCQDMRKKGILSFLHKPNESDLLDLLEQVTCEFNRRTGGRLSTFDLSKA